MRELVAILLQLFAAGLVEEFEPLGQGLVEPIEIGVCDRKPLTKPIAQSADDLDRFFQMGPGRLVRQFAQQVDEIVDLFSNGGGLRIDQAKLLDHAVVQFDRHVGGQTQRAGFENVERVGQVDLGGEQVRPLGFNVLAKQIDLGDLDGSGLLVGFQHAQASQLSVEAGFGVANLLQLLQQADETVDQSRVAAGKTGAAAAGAAADGAGSGRCGRQS